MKCGFVAILGRPNVGKSTLINAILSKKVSIVTPRAQTTREDIMGVYNEKGYQIVFVDTPGLFDAKEGLDKIMNRSARKSLQDVDAALFLLDASAPSTDEDDALLKRMKFNNPVFLVLNKIDLMRAPEVEALIKRYSELFPNYHLIQSSAIEGFGLKEIKDAVKSVLPEGVPFFPESVITDKDPSFMAKEVIREKMLRFLKEEIPHQAAVRIVHYEEDKTGARLIKAMIYVEKPTQKAIVIGKGGTMIKKISMAARHDLETMWKCHVTLVCEVDCIPDWRNSPDKLSALGYGEDDK